MWPRPGVASIGGFIARRTSSRSSAEQHPAIRAPLRARVMTVERELRIIELQGGDIRSAGAPRLNQNGVITRCRDRAEPGRRVGALHRPFDLPARWTSASVSSTPSGAVPVGRRCALSYYATLGAYLPPDWHAMFAMVAPGSMAAFRALVAARRHDLSPEAPGPKPRRSAPALRRLQPRRCRRFRSTALDHCKSPAQPFDPAVDRHIAILATTCCSTTSRRPAARRHLRSGFRPVGKIEAHQYG